MKTKTIPLLLVVAACAACASTPVPADKYARARGAISAAEAVQASNVPDAAAYLTMAKSELEQGKTLLEDGDNERAGYVLLRAEADGHAAMDLARESKAKTEASQTISQVQALQAQLQSQMNTEGATP